MKGIFLVCVLLVIGFAGEVDARNKVRIESLDVLQDRLNRTTLPLFELQDASFDAARNRMLQLFAEVGLGGVKIQFVVDPANIPGFKPQEVPPPKEPEPGVATRLFSMKGENIRLGECLLHVALFWDCDMAVSKGTLFMFPRDTGTPEPLTTKTFVDAGPIMFPNGVLPEKYLGVERIDVRAEISKGGMVHFYKGGFADYYPAKRKLVVCTTQEQHENFEAAWLPVCVLPKNWDAKKASDARFDQMSAPRANYLDEPNVGSRHTRCCFPRSRAATAPLASVGYLPQR